MGFLTARLSDVTEAAGELIVAGDELNVGEPPSPATGETWERRELQVKGRDRPVQAWSLRLEPALAA